MSNQPNQPIRVLQQTAGIHTISINDVARTMEANGNGYDFIHFRRVDMSAQTRLYIPAHLAHVDEFFNALWQLSGLTGFKIAGFKDAQDRSDVIVAWFQHSMHAQAVGAKILTRRWRRISRASIRRDHIPVVGPSTAAGRSRSQTFPLARSQLNI